MTDLRWQAKIGVMVAQTAGIDGIFCDAFFVD
jgi:hypothetical protein